MLTHRPFSHSLHTIAGSGCHPEWGSRLSNTLRPHQLTLNAEPGTPQGCRGNASDLSFTVGKLKVAKLPLEKHHAETSISFCEASAMLQTATRTATRYLTYYSDGVVLWWDNIGPSQYLMLLIGVLVTGYWMLRSDPMKTL